MSIEYRNEDNPIRRPGDDPWLDGVSANNMQRIRVLKGQDTLSKEEVEELGALIENQKEVVREKVRRKLGIPDQTN